MKCTRETGCATSAAATANGPAQPTVQCANAHKSLSSCFYEYLLILQRPVLDRWDCVWINDAIDCSQPVRVQFIDGSGYKGSVHCAAAPAASEGYTRNSSFLFNSPPPVAAPVFHGVGCLNFFDGFTCVSFFCTLILHNHRALLCVIDPALRYSGEFADGLRQGQGVWSSGDGSVRYEGQWSAGLKHGRGTFVSAGQASYVGEFKLGMMDGAGTLLHDDGLKYDGGFRAGLKHGAGKLFFVNGNTYEGAFEKDLMHGRGVLTLADGTQQRGRFQEGFLEGQGDQVSESDVAYSGEWKGGKFHGAGVLRTQEGDRYDGKFSLGLPMGQGSWRLADGASVSSC